MGVPEVCEIGVGMGAVYDVWYGRDHRHGW